MASAAAIVDIRHFDLVGEGEAAFGKPGEEGRGWRRSGLHGIIKKHIRLVKFNLRQF